MPPSGEKFSPKQLNDVAFIFLFGVNTAAIIGWVAYAASAGKYHEVFEAATPKNDGALFQESTAGIDPNHVAILLLCSSLALSVLWAILWLGCLQAFPTQMVYASLIFWIVLMAAIGIAAFVNGAIVVGVICLVGAAVVFGVMTCSAEKIEFTGKCLDCVSTINKEQPLIYGVAILVIIFQAIWQFLIALAVLPLTLMLHAGDASGQDSAKGGAGAGGIYLLFSYYWGSQVFANLLHVTCAGVIARWYFNKQVDNAICKSFGHASTNYIGSICFGSLLIAIIQTMKAVLESFRSRERRSGNVGAEIAAEIAMCLLQCVESMARMFNTLAFIIVAIYGLDYMSAGREVNTLVMTTDVLTPWSFAGIACYVGWLTGGIVVGGLTAFFAWVCGLSSAYIGGLGVAAFLIAVCIMLVVTKVMNSSVESLFVCYAMEPGKLETSAPEVYNAFREKERLYID
eukprot:CAMPEP_0117488700 /NCGR_PEP_ID=MMETSP0784-20121206/16650_1 /TAXON_ID=39447 /ORGANISM="" /LENGTH=455 /DNA_ID=CAMNT_0005283395 /DNA_START=102 /DNA_END=1469 /DNA_ORIENTATION=+